MLFIKRTHYHFLYSIYFMLTQDVQCRPNRTKTFVYICCGPSFNPHHHHHRYITSSTTSFSHKHNECWGRRSHLNMYCMSAFKMRFAMLSRFVSSRVVFGILVRVGNSRHSHYKRGVLKYRS